MFTQLQAEKTRSVEEYMDGVKWLFFDIGSTLVDETKVYDDIFQKIAVAGGVSVEEVKTRAIGFYKQNKRGHREVIRLLGVDYPEWSPLYEELYPDTMECLRILKKKYKLGIIANQIPGAEKRLEEMGIRRYFDVIVSSAEEGVAKPDPRIFNIALIRAGCTPEQAVMIGDRIDNDIVPAKQMGMKTVWIRQGVGRYWNIQGDCETPGYEVNNLSELLSIF
ncbi:HAD family hydrolase [Aristaeella hokkaidonensis]|jgi:8-oxo-dGTP diphosphatase/putative hydrolase of the HAD superfamily|nr:HAD family hydrolase [Aristaeella hokkaidonensis]SNT92486.1 putative hydrolase of the HAD superfamily [Aristaeella hokkaidonensis]